MPTPIRDPFDDVIAWPEAVERLNAIPLEDMPALGDRTLQLIRRSMHGDKRAPSRLHESLAFNGDLTKLGLALGFTLKADWTYPYSDDPRAYREGAESASKALSYLKFVGLDVSRAKALCGIRRAG